MRIKLCEGEGREGLELLCKSNKESTLIGAAKFFTEVAKNGSFSFCFLYNFQMRLV
jgi:hypothetical protein